MKTKNVVIMLFGIAVFAGTAVCGEPEETNEPGYIGIRMDTKPLPVLLTKHLGIHEDQGVRIQNVGVGTPADKAGLERDDIIIAFEGEDVTDSEKFSKAVQEKGGGAEVSLEIIHLGKRKTVELKLTSFGEDFEAKYPPEPELVQSWQPGRMFRLGPQADSWVQLTPDGLYGGSGFGAPGGTAFDAPRYEHLQQYFDNVFKEIYTFGYSEDGKSYTVTIEGSPADDDAKVIVRIEDEEYSTTAGKIDELPEKYQEAAKEALKKARRTAKMRKYEYHISKPVLPKVPDVQIWKHFEREKPAPLVAPITPNEDMLKRIEKQMHELQKRIEELEKRQDKESGASSGEADKPVESAVNENEKI